MTDPAPGPTTEELRARVLAQLAEDEHPPAPADDQPAAHAR